MADKTASSVQLQPLKCKKNLFHVNETISANPNTLFFIKHCFGFVMDIEEGKLNHPV